MRGALLLLLLLPAVPVTPACRFGFDPLGGPPEDATGTSGDGAITGDATDAAPGACEPSACAAAGGSCSGATCEIIETSERLVTCPSAMPCRVICSGAGRPCRDGVACGGATTCDVRCEGFRACQDGVDCADAICEVTCDGDETCEAGINVGPAGTCTSHCCGVESCAGGVGTCVSDSTCS